MSVSVKTSAVKIYLLKIALRGVRPPIWRRILVLSSTKLSMLSNIICTTMGWHGGHLHSYNVDGVEYGEPHPDYGAHDFEDEARVMLSKIAPREKDKFTYEYDFGDSWEHLITVEKILPPDSAMKHPVCLKGARACPPEDCGGAWGYANLLKALADPNNEEHEEMLEWVGEIDPEEFDIEAVNRSLERYTIK